MDEIRQVVKWWSAWKPEIIEDWLEDQPKNDPSYLAIFEDFGWKSVYRSGGWFIWQKAYSGERPQIYSDTDTLIQRNKNLAALFSILMLVQLPLIGGNSWLFRSHPLLLLVYVPLFGAGAYAILRLLAVNKNLKKRFLR
ncbi:MULTISPECIES: DUF2812 domain-containing protein [unclassified Paenibacillus]|uniref:DUF2812 domain-containing protein n=1 Tax=unclassified Paenibacillus TaxID=185978 RepID=UPI000953C3CA|nr:MULTISPECIES: DUF2812 domain-containing protein [unclassified Paenibacillus]ASS67154.1 DUF2812 domain-containing protein [Paenibacillus sp. RUD330]SIQ88022.1 Protein of unknown function [Paenibacillus sp. RU4X]SIR09082.1 Protein of unknown function [Paenibacillus sp. RU4T]